MELGNSRFQFDFNYEDDLQKVLNKRPCHFNYWSFRVETSCWWYFSKYNELWISVKGIPTHFWLNEIYKEIGRKLGAVGAIDDLLGDDEELILVDLKYLQHPVPIDGDVSKTPLVDRNDSDRMKEMESKTILSWWHDDEPKKKKPALVKKNVMGSPSLMSLAFKKKHWLGALCLPNSKPGATPPDQAQIQNLLWDIRLRVTRNRKPPVRTAAWLRTRS